MTDEQKYEAALKAIDNMTNYDNPQSTLENLRTLREEIDIRIEAVEVDMG
jgi:hypothetical protein